MLYHLHLSRHVKGMVKGPVHAVPRGIGYVCDYDENGDAVWPDNKAVRECLPACYRKAFDRSSPSMYSNSKGIHFTLYDTRNKYINTIYCIPNI